MSELPDDLSRSAYGQHAAVGLAAAAGAGAALMRVRHISHARGAREVGDQLKTGVDNAAEGWVLGFLRGFFPGDEILSEEDFESSGKDWDAPDAFWTVDALDGTRSYVDGFDGFCVQLAFVRDAKVRFGVVYEPVLDRAYVAIDGCGAYRIDANGSQRLKVVSSDAWPEVPTFVDSTEPGGRVGEVYKRRNGRFLELGSIGLKLCRVADASADVFAKKLRFKLWDVAPAQVILSEAGARVGLWDGRPIAYDTSTVRFENILAAPTDLFDRVVRDLTTLPVV